MLSLNQIPEIELEMTHSQAHFFGVETASVGRNDGRKSECGLHDSLSVRQISYKLISNRHLIINQGEKTLEGLEKWQSQEPSART